MQSPRILGVLFVLLLAALGGLWWLSKDADAPMPGSGSVAAGDRAAEPARADAGAAPAAPTPATAEGIATERSVATEAMSDKDRPALVGAVVDQAGKPLAGARVLAAPGLAFANANGSLDFDTFDPADLEDAGGFDPTAMMRLATEQLANRVEAITDADGRFRIVPRATTPGVSLRVLARGKALLDRRVERPKAADVDVGTLQVKNAAVVAGRVVAANGKPVAQARVRRVLDVEARFIGNLDIEMPGQTAMEEAREGEVVRTDAEGRFELAHVEPGDFDLRVRHDEHPATRKSGLHVDAGQELRDVLVTVPVGLEIRGTVVGVPEGTKGLLVMAQKRARVDADPNGMMGMFGGGGGADWAEMMGDMGFAFGDRSTEPAADGSFVLKGLANDTYRVWIAESGTGFAGSTMVSARIDAAAGRSGVELRYETGVRVTFTVVDAGTEAPIEALWVRDRLRGGNAMDFGAAMPSTARQRNYPGGRVEVRNLRPKAKQKLSLTVEAVGYRAFEKSDIELPKTGALDLGTVKLEPMPTVIVTVLAHDTGKPVAGASVKVAEPGGRAGNPFANLMRMAGGSGPTAGRTDREGRCTVNARTGGSSLVEVDSKEFALFLSEPTEFAAKRNEFTARLHVGGAAEVAVRDDKDQPVKGAVVEHRAPGGEQNQKKTGDDGLARFDRLAPGAHGFRLGKDGGPMGAMFAQMRRRGGETEEAPWQDVAVADRAQAKLTLQQAPSATLRGIVRENGVPLAGARITFAKGAGTAESPEDVAGRAVGEAMAAFGQGNSRESTTTDARGEYKLADLPDGAHRLRITHKQRAMPTEQAITLRLGDNVIDVDLEVTTLRGVVLGPDGKPLEGARVLARPARDDDVGNEIEGAMGQFMPGMSLGGSNAVKSDAQGAFELKGLAPNTALLVQASAKGLVNAELRLAADKLAEPVRLQLQAAGKVKVTVANAPPFGAVTARWLGEGKEDRKMQMLRGGKGTLDGLRPGSWEIEVATRQDGEGEKRTVEVIANETVTVDM